ncbi:MAG: DUF937 domain-containing protein [Oscillospiraceae bacterium]|nr:DUF937 domain-containing protein [Oscillospiraceae bacterium]
MDLNALLGTMLSEDSISQMSKKTGTTNEEVKSVLLSALPAMLEGVQGQASGDDTVAGFAGALDSHALDDTGDIAAFLSGVDVKDGKKIVGHLLGDGKDATTKAAAKKAGISASASGNILGTAAPLLMSLLGQQATQTVQSQPQGFLSLGGTQQQAAPAQQQSGLGAGLLGSLFGGGAQQQAAPAQQQSGLGAGLLGSLLGGGAQQQAAPAQQQSAGGNLLGGLIGNMLGNVDVTSLLFSLLGSGK